MNKASQVREALFFSMWRADFEAALPGREDKGMTGIPLYSIREATSARLSLQRPRDPAPHKP